MTCFSSSCYISEGIFPIWTLDFSNSHTFVAASLSFVPPLLSPHTVSLGSVEPLSNTFPILHYFFLSTGSLCSAPIIHFQTWEFILHFKQTGVFQPSCAIVLRLTGDFNINFNLLFFQCPSLYLFVALPTLISFLQLWFNLGRFYCSPDPSQHFKPSSNLFSSFLNHPDAMPFKYHQSKLSCWASHYQLPSLDAFPMPNIFPSMTFRHAILFQV